VASTESFQLFALAAAILALGAVYWLVRDQDRSIEQDALADGDRPPRQPRKRGKPGERAS